ncbi:MAG: YfiR family protein [Sulfuricellaceae bacterium]
MKKLKIELRRLLWAAMLACCAGLPTAHALAAPASEYDVKAVFIYNFAKFVDWPNKVGSEIRLCILGRDPFGNILDSMKGRAVHERKLEVRFIDSVASLGGCQMVYVSPSLEKNIDKIIAQARDQGVLLISDSEGYARRGAMINLYVDENKIRFEINLQSIEASGLKVSSKLLSLGKLVN